MARVTNQWLKGVRKRQRIHRPVTVSLTAHGGSEPGVALVLRWRRRIRDYQRLLIHDDEIEALMRQIGLVDEDLPFQMMEGLISGQVERMRQWIEDD